MKWTDESPDNTLPTAGSNIVALTAGRVLSGRASDDCLVLIAPQVHGKVLEHLQSATIEQGGLLIGVPYAAPGADPRQKPYRLHVLDSTAAPNSSGTGFSLRMEASVWSAANEKLASIGTPGARIIGWYHSHPGLGAFFSTTDMTTQAAFFAHDYSIGWVIDPSDDTHALFLGARSDSVSGALIAPQQTP